MAFNAGVFISSVTQLENNPPGDAISFASGWADAFYAGFGKPSPPTLTAEVGKAQMQGLFLAAYQNDNNGKNLMNSGVSVFAAQMAPGMLPAFAAIPPMGLVYEWYSNSNNVWCNYHLDVINNVIALYLYSVI